MEPIKVAVAGLGRRAWSVYFPILDKLGEFFRVAAVCDPLPEYARKAAERFGVPAFSSLRELVAARPMEAVLLVTPVESHHAGSVFLSRHGLPHTVETSMATTLGQCREMIASAAAAGVALHVNEQFFREPTIAFARRVIDSGVIGPVGRITYYHGHTGYHNNSIWQVLAGGPPTAVNSVAAAMPVHRYFGGDGRWQDQETFHLRVLHFAGGLLGVDMAGNIKSALGCCPRPGYLEIDGADGAFVSQPYDRPAPWEGRAEVRLVAPEDYERGAYAESFPVERVTKVGHRVNLSDRLPHGGEFWQLRCRLPGRMLTYDNALAERGLTDGYLSAVALGLLDFHRQVREGAPAEFGPKAAAASTEMESAFARSAELQGARVELPFAAETDAERAALAALRRKCGVDSMDVDAMLDVAFGRNYELSAWEKERGDGG